MHWKKWAAKHECEDLKEGVWLEPGQAFMHKKVKETWTERHRNVAKKIFLEGGWTQKKLFCIGWTDISRCQACHMERRHKNAQALPLSGMARSQAGSPRGFQKVGAESEDIQRKSGSGKGVLSRIFSVTVNGIEATSA